MLTYSPKHDRQFCDGVLRIYVSSAGGFPSARQGRACRMDLLPHRVLSLDLWIEGGQSRTEVTSRDGKAEHLKCGYYSLSLRSASRMGEPPESSYFARLSKCFWRKCEAARSAHARTK